MKPENVIFEMIKKYVLIFVMLIICGLWYIFTFNDTTYGFPFVLTMGVILNWLYDNMYPDELKKY